MPKIRRDMVDDFYSSKEKVLRRKEENYEEFKRDPSKRNKRNKKRKLEGR